MNEKDKKQELAAEAAQGTQTAPQSTQPTPQTAPKTTPQFVQQPVAPYKSGWQQQLSDTMKKIQNRQPFSYDINGDALYEQYKNKYISQGKQAMEDTIGKASAMTGGYGNSYAVNAGNAAYNDHLGKLNDVIPELYQMAYDRYMAEGDELKAQYSLLADREAEDYGRWRDSISDARYADETAYSRSRDAVADEHWREEMKFRKSERDADYAMWMANFNYGAEQDKIDDDRTDADTNYNIMQDNFDKYSSLIMTTGYMPTDAELEEGGMTRAQADALLKYYEESQTPTGVGTVPVTPEEGYRPYGEYTAGEFIDKLNGYSNAYAEDIAMGGDGGAAKRSAIALVNVIDTDEAKAAFRDVFGDAAYEELLASRVRYTPRMKQFEESLKPESELERRGINYEKYLISEAEKALGTLLNEDEFADILIAHGIGGRYVYGK